MRKKDELVIWRLTIPTWTLVIGAAALLGFIYFAAFNELVRIWGIREEYSYGYLIPFITLFLAWQKKDELERIPFAGSWKGIPIVLLGLVVYVLGELSTLYLVIQYSFLIVLAGLVLAFTGSAGFKVSRIPLIFLVFMIPMPSFFLQELSAQLQLVSSEIGVAFIRLFGISVFIEGNVIDLGTFKMQVVDACSGLRYLFPLMTLAFIAAYFFKVQFWKRAVVFLSSIPITILMNSFRIGIIGVMSEYWGRSMAEGFLHDFEGWAVFMVCTAVLIAEMWLFARFSKDRRPLREVFGIEFPLPTPKNASVKYRKLPVSFIGAMGLLTAAAVTSVALPQRVEVSPVRQAFSHFPLAIDEWRGKREMLEDIYLNELKLDDYLLVDYLGAPQKPVNLYVAYYASQKKGQSAHSPRTCIPGGGWKITSLASHQLDGVLFKDRPLVVNRTVIQKDEHKQLVYYWFQQRGRNLTNEYLVKWYIFWDALTRNRTDGALMRVTTLVMPGEEVAEADRRLADFVKLTSEPLKAYIPD